MNSLSFSTSLICPLTCKQSPLSYRLRAHSNCLNWYTHGQFHGPCYSAGFSSIQFHPSATHRSLVRATTPEEGTVAVMNFEELAEKDWSFLESTSSSSKEECNKKIDQLIAAGNIVENSKVLVSTGSEEFVDRLVNSSPCQLPKSGRLWMLFSCIFYLLYLLNLMISSKHFPVAVHQVKFKYQFSYTGSPAVSSMS